MANITYIRIGDKVYRLHDENALTSDSNLNASKVVGTLPANTYTNTTYENKAAVEGGTDVSLVTTGDKYRWNNASGGGLQNLVDGEATGSVRGINTLPTTCDYSTALGYATTMTNTCQLVTGMWNTNELSSNNLFVIGNGTNKSNRSNALTVDESGNVDIASGASYKINGTALSASDVGAQPTLVSGENIKTINNNSILGSGNLTINVPTKVSDLTNDSNFQNATQVESAINTKISSVYKAKGSIAFANLPALTASNEGFVYNITDDFTTTSDFVEGAGAQYVAGTNVVIIDIGSGVYKYDVLASTVATPLGLVQKSESRYVTSASSETTIPIGISGFRTTDVLFVDINGLDLVQGTDYTISGTNIVLTTPITTIGTVVHFVAMRMAEISTQDYAQLKGDPGTIQIVRW